MARKSDTTTEPPAPEAPPTQRAYTLRLRGVDQHDTAWRDALWATHEVINHGTKAFGNWLLTLRGGLDHSLAEAENEDGKPGDIQLFEALAADDAECVWRLDGKADSQSLKDYVFGHDARDKMRRFKVPAFRHPDPLRHPVFGDFGNSRWAIEYAVHQAAKAGRSKRAPATADEEWLKSRHGLRMGLWDGEAVREVPLRWSSKRLSNDLALGSPAAGGPVRHVARADRLGRAASGLKPGERPATAGLFALADWNGRLQAPRAQLDAIAACIERNAGKWDEKARKLRDRIEWLVTFSAKLECQGPFMEYAAQFGDDAPAKPFVSRKGELAVKHATNDDRQGHAKLILSRLPGLRVLSVDLGHRYAASCAVWETLSLSALKKETAGRAVAGGGAAKQHLFLHTRHTDARGTERTTIYRRIGGDRLPDGSEHPAPWARLDRQFLIRLQGEEAPARKASPEEINAVRGMETELGRLRDERNPLPMRVDELMAEAARTVRLALRRLGDSARIAYAFKPDAARLLPGGGAAEHTPETRKVAIVDALMRWHDLATGDRWTDPVAKTTWTQHIVPRLSAELPTFSEEADRWERKRHRAALEVALDPVAVALVSDGAARRAQPVSAISGVAKRGGVGVGPEVGGLLRLCIRGAFSLATLPIWGKRRSGPDERSEPLGFRRVRAKTGRAFDFVGSRQRRAGRLIVDARHIPPFSRKVRVDDGPQADVCRGVEVSLHGSTHRAVGAVRRRGSDEQVPDGGNTRERQSANVSRGPTTRLAARTLLRRLTGNRTQAARQHPASQPLQSRAPCRVVGLPSIRPKRVQPAYWRWVRKRVVASLWGANGLTSSPPDLAPDPEQ